MALTAFLALIFCFFYVSNAGVITNITSLDQVQDSGDNYPQFLPYTVPGKNFSGKAILFVLDHGVEDHEVYYIHQYFKDRGAYTRFGCLARTTESDVVLSDFFKPSYKINCNYVVDDFMVDFTLNNFDVIYIPGGVPSSSKIRSSSVFTAALQRWVFNPDNAQKLLAVICSGTETLIDSDLLKLFPAIVGSPASYIPLEIGFQAQLMPASNYKGLDPLYKAISYKSDGKRANIVIGKNPDTSQEFVVEIGNTWGGFNEKVPPKNQGVPLNLKNGKYINEQFMILENYSQLPPVNDPIPELYPNFTVPSQNVAIAISSGAHAKEVVLLNSYLQRIGLKVTFICPSWVPPYKQGKVFLHTDPPARPTHVAQCDVGFDQLLSGKVRFDGIFVPGGLFSTGGVLRNDNELIRALRNFYSEGQGITVFIGTGSQVLIPTRLGMGASIPAAPLVQRDLEDAGFKINQQEKNLCIDFGICVVTDLISFIKSLESKK